MSGRNSMMMNPLLRTIEKSRARLARPTRSLCGSFHHSVSLSKPDAFKVQRYPD
ncbi:uncharacterized protein An12g07480 [Aspergillus niger]|uniref:Contig An12c0230, genomic contig n=2 Tax=Aspergillus niger TaxID=5061 RepID=A2R058_ASPNC|nr:uncharacterized protein An12g07480 [Aspergillus niger]CAK46372.1 unnamed protein product [Aspergillus niger]